MQVYPNTLTKPLDVAKYDPFLAECPVIDHGHADIQKRATLLSYGLRRDDDIAKACFEWVRDEITHTVDAGGGPVTCKASDVLIEGTGFCYAKSHLLAALLRACGVPAGLAYQRLKDDDAPNTFMLHGLATVHLPRLGWYRMDARGNKPGIAAEFTPPNERLAWPGTAEGEINFREVWATPMREVVDVLSIYSDWRDVCAHLPDVTEA